VKVHAIRRTWSPAILAVAFATIVGVAACSPAAVLAHGDDGAPAPFHGRMPDQPDVRHVGKKTYRYLPGREEYEVTQPGKPRGLLHLDYLPKPELNLGDVAADEAASEGPAIPLPANELNPVCRTEGPRIVLVYTHRPSDGTPTPTGTLRSIVKRMNWKFSDQSSQSSAGQRVVKMALDCNKSGEINVYNVATANNNFASLTAAVASALFGEPTGENAIKYLIFDQSGNEEDAEIYGVGALRVDDQKSHFNYNAFYTAAAAIYNSGGVWENHVTIHELTHALGGAQTDAPHASPGHHCGDGLDALCYADGTIGYFRDYCPYYQGYETPTTVPIDCGKDTYFNAAPEVGSWLAGNWDLAGRENWFLTAPPTASTGFPSGVKGKSATFYGIVDPEGTRTSSYFEYGKTTSYGSKTETSLMPGEGYGSGQNGGSTQVQKEVYGLTPATTYHFRVVAVNRDGVTVPGEDGTFTTTNPPPPAVTTREPSGVGPTEAMLNGTVNPGGVETFYQFEYGPDKGYGELATGFAGVGKANVSLSRKITGLTPDTIYHFRLEATNEIGTTYGEDIWFNTGTNEWGMEATPEPAEAKHARLADVSCSAADACAAVGDYSGSSPSPWIPYAKVQSEGKWSVTSTPQPAGAGSTSLTGVSCKAANACTAVGYGYYNGIFKTLAERWNGTAWTIQTTPNVAGATSSLLKDVSCPATNDCTAVGYSTTSGAASTLVEHWNGTSWTIVSSPNPEGFTKSYPIHVSCASASDCWAVGSTSNKSTVEAALAEHWDGTKWTVNSPTGIPQGLRDITCAASNLCFATIGSAVTVNSSVLVRWNGSSWSQETLPKPGGTITELYAVSCASAISCTVVGVWGTTQPELLAETWNGSSWSIQSVPRPASESWMQVALESVSCPSPGKCTAVGSYDAATKALVEVRR
jgi:hypothetical protein